MRNSWHVNLVAGALVTLMFVAGCGDGTDTNIDIGDETTPTPGARTPTPGKTATVGAKTATPAAAATPTVTSAGAATPTATTNTSNPTPTATPSGSAIDADVQSITSDLLPFLTSTSLLTGGSVSTLTAGAALGEAVRRVEALKNDPCPDGGTRVDDEGLPNRTITLTGCKVHQTNLGHFQFDGTIVIKLNLIGASSIDFDVVSLDLDNGSREVDFSGSLPLTLSGSNFVLNGPLTITTPQGVFTLNTTNITIDSDRHLVSGSGSITDTADKFTVDTITMTVVSGGATANFNVTFDSGPPHTYSLDLASGQLTQTS